MATGPSTAAFPTKVCCENLTTFDGKTLTPSGSKFGLPTFERIYGKGTPFSYQVIREFENGLYDREIGVARIDDDGNLDRYSPYSFDDQLMNRTYIAGSPFQGRATLMMPLESVSFYVATFISMAEYFQGTFNFNWEEDFDNIPDQYEHNNKYMTTDRSVALAVMNGTAGNFFPTLIPYTKDFYEQKVRNLRKKGDLVRNGNSFQVWNGNGWGTI